MQLRLLCTFLVVSFYTATIHAQKSKLLIQINSDRLQLNDTLDFTATYKLGEKQLPPATLALVMKENNGDGIWQMRWPMINGYAEASLIFPRGITRGNYTLYFAVQPRFFRVYGRVLYPPGIKKLNGEIAFPYAHAQELTIPVENGAFKIDKLLFENTAVLELNIEPKRKMPAITVDAWLDSTFEPAASASKEIIIGMGDTSQMENKKVNNWMDYFDPFYRTTILGDMPAVQKFDSVYVSVPFKTNVIRQFDCLDDSTLMKSKSLEAFLGKHFPGFKMDPATSEFQTPQAHTKDYDFIFYLDEKPTSFAALDNLKLSDIALIKVLPPIHPKTLVATTQFLLALYTKQGPFCGQDVYRYKYIINGYQPATYQLPHHPRMFATNPYYLR